MDVDFDIPQAIVIGLTVLLLWSIIKGARMPPLIHSHWHHRFEAPPFSSMEFYKEVEASLNKKEIKYIETSMIEYRQGGLLSPQRKYLRIKYREYVFDVCAAPFAIGYFVSWWLGEMVNPLRDIFINIPLVGKLFRKRKKRFYELDTELMFKDMVASCIKDTVEQKLQTQGLRALDQREWQIADYNSTR